MIKTRRFSVYGENVYAYFFPHRNIVLFIFVVTHSSNRAFFFFYRKNHFDSSEQPL